ncbi:MAG: HEAT repeat domain-containing protein [bacterium]
MCRDGRRMDLRSALARALLTVLVCVGLYAACGYGLVRLHAQGLAAAAGLLRDHQMQCAAVPGDPYLVGISHQLGGALLFGVMLGTAVALVLCAVLFPARLLGCRGRAMGVVLAGGSMAAALFLSFSFEMPAASVVSGLAAASFTWWLSGRRVSERAGQERGSALRTVLFALVLLLPLAPLRNASFQRIRDAMMDLPVARGICDFYYNHTLIPAHAVQPLLYRTQRVIAFSAGMEIPEPLPDRSLWLEAADPCAVQGASVVVSRETLECDSLVLPGGGAPVRGTEVLLQASRRFDGNKALRRGIRLFMHGALPALVILLALWLATLMEKLSRRHMGAVLLLAAGGLALAGRGFQRECLERALLENPARGREYVASGSALKRYLVLSRLPELLKPEQLESLARDASARVRHAALLRMGEWRDARFLPALEEALADPVQVVRTKACLGLGEIGGEEGIRMLEDVLARDPSWYVRDYACRAIGNIRPVSKIVKMRPAGCGAPPAPGLMEEPGLRPSPE